MAKININKILVATGLQSDVVDVLVPAAECAVGDLIGSQLSGDEKFAAAVKRVAKETKKSLLNSYDSKTIKEMLTKRGINLAVELMVNFLKKK